jgi:hypothetical protein
MEYIEGLAELLDRIIETYDVTDTVSDLSTRLSIAEDSRERLYAILESTNDPEERVNILREIRRLTEQIEQIKQTLELFKNRIAFSRITIEIYNPLASYENARQRIPYPWMQSLDPLSPPLYSLETRFLPDLDERFALLEKGRRFRAESAKGTVLSAFTVENNPSGDVDFWVNAAVFNLANFFASNEILDGNSVLFTSRSGYHFLLVFKVEGRKLHIAQALFPDDEEKNSYLSFVNEIYQKEFKIGARK